MCVFLLAISTKDLLHNEAIELVVVSDKECPSGYVPRLGYDESLCAISFVRRHPCDSTTWMRTNARNGKAAKQQEQHGEDKGRHSAP